MRRTRFALLAATISFVGLTSTAPSADAIHWYRNTSGGCSAASGELTDGANGPIAATVLMLHNTFNDTTTGGPVTHIKVGEAVRWTWNSAHCHSATGAFDSGFHYPAAEPSTPRALAGLFEYPVPELEASLAYTHTFTEPGTFTYVCVHHAPIGMIGTVVVT